MHIQILTTNDSETPTADALGHASFTRTPAADSPGVSLLEFDIPTNRAGTLQTLAEIRQLAREGRGRLDVKELAVGIIRAAAHGTDADRVRLIQLWVQSNMAYNPDPAALDMDQLQGVDITFKYRGPDGLMWGDCDDHAVLVAALLGSIGYRCRFVALSRADADADHCCHVLVECVIGGRWVPVETTKPYTLGQLPQGYKVQLEMAA